MPNDLDPFDATSIPLDPLPDEGVQVVTSEATGNTHWLHRGFASPDVTWGRVTDELVEVVVSVPVGQSAVLAHTDEHGANGIGAGLYVIRGKREAAEAIRRVAD